MCDFSGKLIAWLDRELPAEEAADVERHLEDCSECRASVDAYKKVSGEFDAYCDAAMASSARRGAPRWAPVAVAAGAAALVALFLVMPRTRTQNARVSSAASSARSFPACSRGGGSRSCECDPKNSSAGARRPRAYYKYERSPRAKPECLLAAERTHDPDRHPRR